MRRTAMHARLRSACSLLSFRVEEQETESEESEMGAGTRVRGSAAYVHHIWPLLGWGCVGRGRGGGILRSMQGSGPHAHEEEHNHHVFGQQHACVGEITIAFVLASLPAGWTQFQATPGRPGNPWQRAPIPQAKPVAAKLATVLVY